MSDPLAYEFTSTQTDGELLALELAWKSIQYPNLSSKARLRVARWLFDRLESEDV